MHARYLLLLLLGVTAPARAGVVVYIPSSAPSVSGVLFPLNPLSAASSPLPPPSSSPSLAASLIPALAAPSIAEPASRALNTFWDGMASAAALSEPPSAAVPLAGVPDGALEDDSRLAPWLETSDAKVAAALDRAVALARGTKAGRRALDEAERVLSEQGRALPIRVLALGRNYGEYDYVEKSMSLHKALFKPGRETDLAGTLIHELTHVAQHALGIPGNALEMEIEAHLQDLDMLRELGQEPPPNTFARQAFHALAESPAKFIALLQAAVPGTVFLGDTTLEDIEEQLEQDLETHSEKAARSKASAGLVPLIERDLDRIRSPEGRASYKAFSRRVLALLRRRAAA